MTDCMKGYQSHRLLGEEFKEEALLSEEGSACLRQMFGGVKLARGKSPQSSDTSDISDSEENDGMLFRTKQLKVMSFEERKDYLDTK